MDVYGYYIYVPDSDPPSIPQNDSKWVKGAIDVKILVRIPSFVGTCGVYRYTVYYGVVKWVTTQQLQGLGRFFEEQMDHVGSDLTPDFMKVGFSMKMSWVNHQAG